MREMTFSYDDISDKKTILVLDGINDP